ncbi:MAG: TIGR02186 family protein [Alphaproteobacteria bacterium]
MMGRIVFLFVLFMGPVGAAWSQPLLADLSHHMIAIQTDFQGQDLILFGTLDEALGLEDDLVILVKGPSETLDVRQKGKQSGLWMTEQSVRFENIPSFYHIYRYGTLASVSAATLARQELTLDKLKLPIKDLKNPFRIALMEKKKTWGLYKEDTTSIVFRGPHLFRADVDFPVRVKTGQYSVTVFLFKKGDIVAAQTTPLMISKDGIGADIFFFAHRHALGYALLAIAIALFSGWMAFVIMRKRSL